MYHRGRQSEAHEYDERSQCIHCGMYRSNVEALSHVCKPHRENFIDEQRKQFASSKVPAGCTCDPVKPSYSCAWCCIHRAVGIGQTAQVATKEKEARKKPARRKPTRTAQPTPEVEATANGK